jgi:hypothetical protein
MDCPNNNNNIPHDLLVEDYKAYTVNDSNTKNDNDNDTSDDATSDEFDYNQDECYCCQYYNKNNKKREKIHHIIWWKNPYILGVASTICLAIGYSFMRNRSKND